MTFLNPEYLKTHRSSKVNDYKSCQLSKNSRSVTSAVMFGIKKGLVTIKIGRYSLNHNGWHSPDVVDGVKQGLTLSNEELENLIKFIEQDYKPLNLGVKKYIELDSNIADHEINYLKNIFNKSDTKSLVNAIVVNEIISTDLFKAVDLKLKHQAIKKFEGMLLSDPVESEWQKFFTDNDWVFNSQFVEILEERRIDTKNISDYLMKSVDGFLEVVEIKRCKTSANFWSNNQDHGNYVPHSDLVKAITQCQNYLYEIERESNSDKFSESTGGVKSVKPRITLLFGRSNDWDINHFKAFRILNASYHSMDIITYDMLLQKLCNIYDFKSEITDINAKEFPF